MTNEEIVRHALELYYVIEVEYGDGGSEFISKPLPLWGCMELAKGCATLWGGENSDIFYVTLGGIRIMKYSFNEYKDYVWSVCDGGKLD